MTQIIQASGAKYYNPAIGGILVGGNKLSLKLLVNCKNSQSICRKALCRISTDEPNLSLEEIFTGWIRVEH